LIGKAAIQGLVARKDPVPERREGELDKKVEVGGGREPAVGSAALEQFPQRIAAARQKSKAKCLGEGLIELGRGHQRCEQTCIAPARTLHRATQKDTQIGAEGAVSTAGAIAAAPSLSASRTIAALVGHQR